MPEYITELFTHVLSGVAGGLITLFLNHLLSKDRDRTLKRETEIRFRDEQADERLAARKLLMSRLTKLYEYIERA